MAVGGDATFQFTSTFPRASNLRITTTGGSGFTFFNDVPRRTYAISETVPAGWKLAGVVCSDGDDPGRITLAAGETIVCTFGNEKNDTIIVEKRTIGGDGSFPFTSDHPGRQQLHPDHDERRHAHQLHRPTRSPPTASVRACRPAGT